MTSRDAGTQGGIGAKTRPVDCCGQWTSIEAHVRLEWPWQVVHTLAHSRVPFSRARFGEMARTTDAGTEDLIAAATRMKWVRATDAEDLFIGRLAPRRK